MALAAKRRLLVTEQFVMSDFIYLALGVGGLVLMGVYALVSQRL